MNGQQGLDSSENLLGFTLIDESKANQRVVIVALEHTNIFNQITFSMPKFVNGLN